MALDTHTADTLMSDISASRIGDGARGIVDLVKGGSFDVLIVDADGLAAAALRRQLERITAGSHIREVRETQAAWSAIRATPVDAIFIDPLTIGVANAERFIFGVRQAFARIPFVLHWHPNHVLGRAELFRGDRERWRHYFTVDKQTRGGPDLHKLSAIIDDCRRYAAKVIDDETQSSGTGASGSEAVDVLIVTAMKDELDAVLKIKDGIAVPWRAEIDPLGFRYHVAALERDGGPPIWIAAARAGAKGMLPTATTGVRLVQRLAPRCIAMSGVCAGRRGAVSQGDVIVADRVYQYTEGKQIVRSTRNRGGGGRTEVFHDLTTYNLEPTWKQQIEDFPRNWADDFAATRPPTLVDQMRWLRQAIHEHKCGGPDPRKRDDRARACPDWPKALAALRARGEVASGAKLAVTRAGVSAIEHERTDYPDGLVPAPFRVHVGPIATGTMVIEDPEIFDRLRRVERETLGLEMEAAAVGFIAAEHGVRLAIVAKGVQDFADHEKDDTLRHFAAEASARFLFAFFRRHLPITSA